MLVTVALLAAVAVASFIVAGGATASRGDDGGGSVSTATPIKHLVVIFQENVSFDHYFATYPNAANTDGTPFTPNPETPSVNGLNEALNAPNNPNSQQPFRLSRAQYETCDQGHGYKEEQLAFDHGLMDKFVETTGRGAGACLDYGHGKGNLDDNKHPASAAVRGAGNSIAGGS